MDIEILGRTKEKSTIAVLITDPEILGEDKHGQLHLLYENGEYFIRKVYPIALDEDWQFLTIQEAYSKFIKFVVEEELSKIPRTYGD